jgi:holliday junction DNA helicase RuvB
MISSSKQDEPKSERIITPEVKSGDSSISENILRPKMLRDYVGQEIMKKHLSVSIESAKKRKAPLDHIIFYGPPGLGKTTIANIIANEMGSHIKSSSGPAVEKQSDIVSILSNLEEGDILFIDEIHRLRPQIEEILYTAMEDFSVDIMVGTGTGAQSVKLPVKPFTLLGATTKLSSLSAPLRDRFWNVMKLDFYGELEIAKILENNTSLLGLNLTKETIKHIAKRSRGTPRIANRLLKISRDYHTIGKDISQESELKNIFEEIGIDELGLDYLDKKYLEVLHLKFNGWPTGLNTIASAIGEEEGTLEDVVEPYLLQIGFIDRTPRGRKITTLGIEHITK